jgi:Protein of unknown function (DUF3499)
MRCGHEPVVTVSLRYAERTVVVEGLRHELDPNHLDLCREHADRLTAPVGWEIQDRRTAPVAV